MIKTFKNKQAEHSQKGIFVKSIPEDIRKRLKMRLDRINAATELNDLLIPPSHRLEALKGDREGQHSIRVNDQYRICFEFIDGHAYNVEITDYH